MAEYAVVIAAVAAALSAVGIFFKAGLQKRIKSLSQELDGRAYAPRMTTSSSEATANISITESYSQGVSHIDYSESTTKTGTEEVFQERE